jgi:tetratricopeptide (TPR) repeat protein
MSRWIAAAVLIVAGIAAYAHSFTGVFLFDDIPSIVDNPFVKTAAPWTDPMRAMTAPKDVTVSGRPVASFSFAMNYALAPADARDAFLPPPPGSLESADRFLRNAWSYHATNLAIHLLAALTLFGIARRTFESPKLRATTGRAAVPLAFLIALVWVVHPLNTGAVTYIVQRVESLMGLFFLLTLYCAIRARSEPELKFRPTYFRPTFFGIASVFFCALGMGTKEAMVTAPLVVMLWDWTFDPAPLRDVLKRRWLFYVWLFATWIILTGLVSMGARTLSVGFGFAEWPWWRYLITQFGVIVHYLRLAIVPVPLVLDYAGPPAREMLHIIVPGAILLTLGIISLWQLAKRKPLGFLGACFFVILAPSSSILPVITEVAAEHRMYLPLAAVIATVIGGGYWLIRRQKLGSGIARAAFVAALGIAVFFAWTTDARNADYTSDERMWSDVVAKQPHNARARNNYGSNLLKTGQARPSEEHFRAAVEAEPGFAEAHANLGISLAVQGKHAEALASFERALEINPFYTSVYDNIGEAYGTQHNLKQAARYFQKALDQKPDDVALLNKTAWILATAKDDDARDGARALTLAQHAAELTNRRDVLSLDTLAVSFAEAGRFDEALATGEEAIRLAQEKNDPSLVSELEMRLTFYRAKRPFRQE